MAFNTHPAISQIFVETHQHYCKHIMSIQYRIKQIINIQCQHPDHLLTHWGRETHICVIKLTSIGSDNGLSPGRRQAIIWTNAGILFIGPLGTNFSEILIEIYTFSFKKLHFKMSSGKWRPFCLGLNVLIQLHWPFKCWARIYTGPKLDYHCTCRCPSTLWRWLTES